MLGSIQDLGGTVNTGKTNLKRWCPSDCLWWCETGCVYDYGEHSLLKFKTEPP